MNTEPPQGDDLQRMLVSMKQNVLERATPLPKRRRGRSGIVIGVVALLAVGTATGAVALTLSQQNADPVAAPTQTQQPEPAPSSTTPSSAPITGAPIPKPTPTSTPSNLPVSGKRIPGSCSLLVPPGENARFFGAAKNTEFIVDNGGDAHASTPRERIDGLTEPDASLMCSWQNEGMVARIAISISKATSADAADAENSALGSGGSCEIQFGGKVCRSEFTAQADTVPTTETAFVRDDILIDIQQTDFPTDGLLPAIVGQIWGD